MTELLLSSGQAARLLGISSQTIRVWCEQGVIKPYAITSGGHRRFRLADIYGLLHPPSEVQNLTDEVPTPTQQSAKPIPTGQIARLNV
jgi:excisionase family DNA binding protein